MDYKTKFKCLIIIAAILFASMGLLYFIGHPVMVVGSSMKPTYKGGEILFTKVDFTKEDVKRGSVIVFKHNGKSYIKRVVALPGETVEIKDRTVYINGEALKEDYISKGNWIKKGQEGKWIIPEGQYFMMGDNRDNSTDSRAWGTIEKKDIVAKAFLRYRFWKPLIKGIE